MRRYWTTVHLLDLADQSSGCSLEAAAEFELRLEQVLLEREEREFHFMQTTYTPTPAEAGDLLVAQYPDNALAMAWNELRAAKKHPSNADFDRLAEETELSLAEVDEVNTVFGYSYL